MIDYVPISGGPQGAFYWDTNNVIMAIASAGQFDSVDFNATSFNRGEITIFYEP